MAALSEKTYASEWLKWLINPAFCLQTVTLADDTMSLKSGSLMADSGDGWVEVSNGSEGEIDGILIHDIEAEGEEEVLVLTNGPAVIDPDKLDYPEDVAWAEIADALAALDIRPYPTEIDAWDTQTT